MTPPYRRSFSVSVVLPASGWAMIANVRRRPISCRALKRRFSHVGPALFKR
jgi:hypothetical protein